MQTVSTFGPEITLTPLDTNSDDPAIVGLTTGGFIVTFDSPVDGLSVEIAAQVFNADGSPAGDPFTANTTQDGAQTNPSVAPLAEGGFVVAYDQADGENPRLLAQMYEAGGAPIGSEILLTDTGSPDAPRLAPTNAGGFFVAWEEPAPRGFSDLFQDDIGMQTFGANGAATGAALVLGSTNAEFDPDAALLRSGRQVVAFENSDDTITVHILRANGTLLTTVMPGNIGNDSQDNAAIAGLADGNFVVLWDGFGATDSREIRGQIYDQQGNEIGAPFTANTANANSQDVPDVVGLADGRFAVVWEDSSFSADDPSGTAIRGQVFDADGTRFGQEFLVNSPEGSMADPQIAALVDGRFVVTWENNPGDGVSPGSVRARIFDARDEAISLEGSDAGDDFIGTKFADTIAGGRGADRIDAGDGSDEISGGSQRDFLTGGAGADTLNGGGGNDTANGDAGDDSIAGGGGGDMLSGGTGDDALFGNNGSDLLAGGADRDTLDGGLGADTLQGDAGNDRLVGLEGFDLLQGGDNRDTLLGNAGNDTLQGDDGVDRLEGGFGADMLLGGAGGDQLFAGNGFDILEGGAGGDRLEGNAGNDTLNGGAGTDVLRGGIGADVFVFEQGSGNDRIADLQRVDTVQLDAALLNGAGLDGLSTFVQSDAGDTLVLGFGGGDTLTFTGVTDLANIADAFVLA